MSISKHRLKKKSAMLLLLLLVTMLLPVSAFAAELPTAMATITVEKKLTGDTPPNAETFTFTITPDNENYPMPEGTNGNTLTIQGAGTASFGAITYAEPNTYTYTVREIPGNASNYTYDNTVYKVKVYVTTDDDGNLTAKVWLNKDDADGKSAKAVFTNSYKNPTSPIYPKTGDTSNHSFWIIFAGGFAAMLLFILIGSKRKKEAHRNYK